MDTLKPELVLEAPPATWAKVNGRRVPGPAERRGQSPSCRSSVEKSSERIRWGRYWTTAGYNPPLSVLIPNLSAYRRITASIKWGCENKYANEGDLFFCSRINSDRNWMAENYFKTIFSLKITRSHKYSGNVVNSAQAFHFCQAQWIIYPRGL